LGGGGGAVAESFPSFGHVVGSDCEYDIAWVRADEMKIAVAADETSWRSITHVRIFCRSGSIHRSRGKINRDLHARDRNFDLYQFRTDAAEGKAHGLELEFAAVGASVQTKGAQQSRATAHERVEDQVAFVRGGEDDAFEERDGLLRWMLAEELFFAAGWEDFPDAFHLLSTVGFFHQLIVEGVAALFVFCGPDDGFGGVGEIAAGEIGRRVGLDPGDVVQEFEIKLLHGEADGMDYVACAADPNRSVGFEDALTGGEPCAVEFMVGVGAARTVPIAFVDADHAAGVAGDAVVGEEVGRVGENQVHAGFWDFCEDFEAVALENFDVMFWVVEDGRGQRRVSSRIDRHGIKLSGFAHSGGLGREKCDRLDR